MSDPVRLICGDGACFEIKGENEYTTGLDKNRDGIIDEGDRDENWNPVDQRIYNSLVQGFDPKMDTEMKKALKEVTDIIREEFGISVTPQQMLTSGGANGTGTYPLEIVFQKTNVGNCGQYIHGPNRVVINDDPISKLCNPSRTLRHESAHAVMSHYLGIDYLPRWVVEGFAEYVTAPLSSDLRMTFFHPPAGNLNDFPWGEFSSPALASREDQAYIESGYAFVYLKQKGGTEGLRLFMEGLKGGKDPEELFAALTKKGSFAEAQNEFKEFLRGEWESHPPSTLSAVLRSSWKTSIEFFPGSLRTGPLGWGAEVMLSGAFRGVGSVVRADPLIHGSFYSFLEPHLRGGVFLGENFIDEPSGKLISLRENGFYGGMEMVIVALDMPITSTALQSGFTYQSPTLWSRNRDKGPLTWEVGLRLTLALPWL